MVLKMIAVSMVLALTMAPDTVAFQLRPQCTTRMKGTSQLFQSGDDRPDLPERVASLEVEANMNSIKGTLERIERDSKEQFSKLDTSIKELDTQLSGIFFTLVGLVTVEVMVAMFKGILT
jgi:hypothetical protein